MNRILRTLAFTLTGFLAMQSFAADAPKVLFEEKFTDRLDPGWKWIRERPDAWRLANGALIEDTLPGSYWEKQNSSQNTLVRPAPVSLKEGFIVEVFLESEPKGGYEHAGLLCYFDGYNTLILNKESIAGKGYVLMVAEEDGKPRRDGPHNSEYPERGVWMRMTVRDGKIHCKFRSSEKVSWQSLGKLSPPKSTKELLVGLHSGYGQEKPERHASFSHFRILAGSE
jgi:beta-xylosidase